MTTEIIKLGDLVKHKTSQEQGVVVEIEKERYRGFGPSGPTPHKHIESVDKETINNYIFKVSFTVDKKISIPGVELSLCYALPEII